MALSRDKDQIKDNVFTLTVDGNEFPYALNMRVNKGYFEKEINAMQAGRTPLGDLILGHVVEITIQSQQLSASLPDFLDLVSGVPLAVGSFRTQHAVVLHPVSMGADASDDIIIPVATFGPTVDSTKDGANEDTGTIMIRGRWNPDGPVFRQGPEPE